MNLTQEVTAIRMEYSKKPKGIRVDKSMTTAQYNKNLKEACDGFETLFLHKMIQTMRQSTHKIGLLDGGRGEEIFQDMLDEKYAELFTKTESLGLSQMLYEKTKKKD